MSVKILDGAIGTELVARGLAVDEPAWTGRASLDAPELLADVHADYAAAGATLHTANTFRTQPRVLGRDWSAALEASVRIARASVPEGHRVLGSMAPIEDCYRPDRSPGEAARDDHRLVAEALASAGCDVLLCETFANGEEARVAVEEAVRTGLPVWLSLTAGPFADLHTPEALRKLAARAISHGVERLLVNCVAASSTLPYVAAIADLGLEIGVYANAGARGEGLGWGEHARGATDAYATFAGAWIDRGATVVGGCCGTGPAHIAKLAERYG